MNPPTPTIGPPTTPLPRAAPRRSFLLRSELLARERAAQSALASQARSTGNPALQHPQENTRSPSQNLKHTALVTPHRTAQTISSRPGATRAANDGQLALQALDSGIKNGEMDSSAETGMENSHSSLNISPLPQMENLAVGIGQAEGLGTPSSHPPEWRAANTQLYKSTRGHSILNMEGYHETPVSTYHMHSRQGEYANRIKSEMELHGNNGVEQHSESMLHDKQGQKDDLDANGKSDGNTEPEQQKSMIEDKKEQDDLNVQGTRNKITFKKEGSPTSRYDLSIEDKFEVEETRGNNQSEQEPRLPPPIYNNGPMSPIAISSSSSSSPRRPGAYTRKEMQWLLDSSPPHNWESLAAQFKDKFGYKRTAIGLRSKRANLVKQSRHSPDDEETELEYIKNLQVEQDLLDDSKPDYNPNSGKRSRDSSDSDQGRPFNKLLRSSRLDPAKQGAWRKRLPPSPPRRRNDHSDESSGESPIPEPVDKKALTLEEQAWLKHHVPKFRLEDGKLDTKTLVDVFTLQFGLGRRKNALTIPVRQRLEQIVPDPGDEDGISDELMGDGTSPDENSTSGEGSEEEEEEMDDADDE